MSEAHLVKMFMGNCPEAAWNMKQHILSLLPWRGCMWLLCRWPDPKPASSSVFPFSEIAVLADSRQLMLETEVP